MLKYSLGVSGVGAVITSTSQNSNALNLLEAKWEFSHKSRGADWREGRCPVGNYQSPIDLPHFDVDAVNNEPKKSFSYRYQSYGEPIKVRNTGHGLSVDLLGTGIGGVTFDGHWYDALAINFRARGEHTFEGRRPMGEVQIVHKKEDSPTLLVTAFPLTAEVDPEQQIEPVAMVDHPDRVLFVGQNGTDVSEEQYLDALAPIIGTQGMESYAEDHVLEGLVYALDTHMPAPHITQNVEYNPLAPFDLNFWFDNSGTGAGETFLHYYGSLTTPPCAEDVHWLVRGDPIRISNDQMRSIFGSLTSIVPGGNYRAIHPKGHREVTTILAQQGPERSDDQLPYTKNPPKRADPTSRAEKVNMIVADAVNHAKTTTEYMEKVDARLRRGAHAYATELVGGEHPEPHDAEPSKRIPWNEAANQIYNDAREAIAGQVIIFLLIIKFQCVFHHFMQI